MTQPSAVTIQDAAELEVLVPDWWSLWSRSPAATPFQSPAWLLSWWQAFAPGELAVVAVHRGAQLIGLAPFYVESGARVLPLGISVSDYLDVLLDPDHERLAADAMLSAFRDRASAWDTWEFCELAPQAAALRLPCPAWCRETAEPSSRCPVLALPDTIEGLSEVVPRRQMRELRLARNRTARRNGAEIVSAETSNAAGILAALCRLHGARWNSKGEPGVLADPRTRDFHGRAVPRLREAGLLRLFALKIEGEIAAVHYGLFHRSRAYAYLTGFHPKFAFESPGTILLTHAIETAIEEGAREFHFLRGDEPYKYGWGASDRVNRRRVFQRIDRYARAS